MSAIIKQIQDYTRVSSYTLSFASVRDQATGQGFA